MTRSQAEQAIETGRRIAREIGSRFDIIAAGEMGIGNTTAASALLSVFSGRDAAETCGRGTGVDDAGLARKIDAVRRGIAFNRPDPQDPVGVLAAVGGFEIGAIAGLILGAAEARLAVVLDGFICCAAALVARAIHPAAMDSVLFSHQSAERGHALMLEELGGDPYLHLDMRLGEGTGAALLIGLLDAALRLYREMATFDDLERMRWMLTTGTAIGHAGELLQGALPDGSGACPFLITLPAPSLLSTARTALVAGPESSVTPPEKQKALTAARLFLRQYGISAAIRLTIESNIPVSRGCGSSTSDCVAAVRACRLTA